MPMPGLAASVIPVTQFEVSAGVRPVLGRAEDLLPHQWVEKYRPLHEKGAAESGPFSVDKIPHTVKPTDAVAAARVRVRCQLKRGRPSPLPSPGVPGEGEKYSRDRG